MYVDLDELENLLNRRTRELEKRAESTGYLLRTVVGVATFLLDNEGNVDLLTAKQQVTYEKFLEPLLESAPRR